MKNIVMLLMLTGLFTACKSGADKAAAIENQRQKTVDSMNTVLVKQKAIDSMKLVQAKNAQKTTHVVQYEQTNQNAAAKPKKKWSNTAKGAVIGAGVGAVSGAIIDKKHGEGAVVGGLIGAGVGTTTGLIIDKNKKKKKTTSQQKQ